MDCIKLVRPGGRSFKIGLKDGVYHIEQVSVDGGGTRYVDRQAISEEDMCLMFMAFMAFMEMRGIDDAAYFKSFLEDGLEVQSNFKPINQGPDGFSIDTKSDIDSGEGVWSSDNEGYYGNDGGL